MRSLDMVYSHTFRVYFRIYCRDLWVTFLVDVSISALIIICISIIRKFEVLTKIRMGDVEFVVSWYFYWKSSREKKEIWLENEFHIFRFFFSAWWDLLLFSLYYTNRFLWAHDLKVFHEVIRSFTIPFYEDVSLDSK